MAIIWRRASPQDIGPCLALQPTNRGDAFPDLQSAIPAWEELSRASFFLSAVIEASPPVQGQSIIGFGSAVLVRSQFLDSEIAKPRPYVASRVFAGLAEGTSVLATRELVATANADRGVDVVVLYTSYRSEILNDALTHDVRTAFVDSLIAELAGYRVSRVLSETTSPQLEALHRDSPEHRVIAEFPEIGHVLHLMTEQSVSALPGSKANPLFRTAAPVLRLRSSDQKLLLAALAGATDIELASELGTTLPAIKARWRSTYARVADAMPTLLNGGCDEDTRGTQKRHRVLAYLRSHMEELRPYDWSERTLRAAIGAPR